MDQMSYIWKALAKKDCQDSVDTLYETTIAFPELLALQDEEIQEHLEKICELLCLDAPWEDENGS
tara:strand:- start:998 stop:1192 length:195 start_codon:yes stop_codon:yes gene_type:complete